MEEEDLNNKSIYLKIIPLGSDVIRQLGDYPIGAYLRGAADCVRESEGHRVRGLGYSVENLAGL